MFLVFDTETTGLPPYLPRGKGVYPPEEFERWNDCRIVQLAWVICHDSGEIVKSRDYLIKPKYFIIPEDSTKIHGITQERAKKEGKKIEDVLREFLNDVEKVRTLVAHNIQFDYPVVIAECSRSGIDWEALKGVSQHCTMKAGSSPLERWKKLAVLYEEYFGSKPELTLHQAGNDVELCRMVYLEQKRRERIREPNERTNKGTE